MNTFNTTSNKFETKIASNAGFMNLLNKEFRSWFTTNLWLKITTLWIMIIPHNTRTQSRYENI